MGRRFATASLCLAVGSANLPSGTAAAAPCQLRSWVLVAYREGAASGLLDTDPRQLPPIPPPGTSLPAGSYWFRLTLHNLSEATSPCVLLPPEPSPLVEVFTPGQLRPLARTGLLLPLDQRSMGRPHPALLLHLPPGESSWLAHLWVPKQNHLKPKNLVFQTSDWASFSQREQRASHLHGLYGGVMLAMVLYNVFLYLSLRRRLYLLYALYAAAFGAIWLVRAGMALAFLWPSWPSWDVQASFFLVGFAMVAGNAFTSEFLELKKNLPWAAKLLRFFSCLVLALLLTGAFQLYDWVEKPLALMALATCAVYLGAGLTLFRAGSRLAGYFLLATSLLLIGIVAYTLAFLGLLPTSPFTTYAAQAGSGAEMLLFAFAVGYRMRELERENRLAEQRYISQLEAAVSQRTEALKAALTEALRAQEEAELSQAQLAQANRQLEHLSSTDPLTGLANRRQLDKALDQEWRRASRTGSTLALVLVDLDYFKAYNDALGHPAGDQLLQQFGQQLADLCRRSGELAARYGGEEFVLVLPGMDAASARLLAEKLVATVQQNAWPHPASPLGPHVTVSCGVAVGRPVEGVPVERLVQQADEALYVAKSSGRNRVHLRPVSGSFPRLVGS